MKDLPTGTVTFLFTDIEGSTALLQRLGDRRYAEVLEEHRRLVRVAIQEHGGQEVDSQGDALFAVFPSAKEAMTAAVAAQRTIKAHPWPPNGSVGVRARTILLHQVFLGIDSTVHMIGLMSRMTRPFSSCKSNSCDRTFGGHRERQISQDHAESYH